MRGVCRCNEFGSEISDYVWGQSQWETPSWLFAIHVKGESRVISGHCIWHVRLCLHPSAVLSLSPVAVYHHATNWEAGSFIQSSSLEALLIEMARHMQGAVSRSTHQPEISMATLFPHKPKPETRHFVFHDSLHAVSDGTTFAALAKKHKSWDATGEGFCSGWWMRPWSPAWSWVSIDQDIRAWLPVLWR